MTPNADYGTGVGVIVGMPMTLTNQQAADIIEQLTTRFPGVTFAIVSGTTSLWFPLPPNDGSRA